MLSKEPLKVEKRKSQLQELRDFSVHQSIIVPSHPRREASIPAAQADSATIPSPHPSTRWVLIPRRGAAERLQGQHQPTP
jgi:hypothetical protein